MKKRKNKIDDEIAFFGTPPSPFISTVEYIKWAKYTRKIDAGLNPDEESESEEEEEELNDHNEDDDDDRMSLSSLSSNGGKLEDNSMFPMGSHQMPLISGFENVPPYDFNSYTQPQQYPSFFNSFLPTSSTSVPAQNDHDDDASFEIEQLIAEFSSSALDDCLKDLKEILTKDIYKKILENYTYKLFDKWWEDNEKKSKTNDTKPAEEHEPEVYKRTNIDIPLFNPLYDRQFSGNGLANRQESVTSNFQFGLGRGLKATMPKMPSFKRKIRLSPQRSRSRRSDYSDDEEMDDDNSSRSYQRKRLYKKPTDDDRRYHDRRRSYSRSMSRSRSPSESSVSRSSSPRRKPHRRIERGRSRSIGSSRSSRRSSRSSSSNSGSSSSSDHSSDSSTSSYDSDDESSSSSASESDDSSTSKVSKANSALSSVSSTALSETSSKHASQECPSPPLSYNSLESFSPEIHGDDDLKTAQGHSLEVDKEYFAVPSSASASAPQAKRLEDLGMMGGDDSDTDTADEMIGEDGREILDWNNQPILHSKDMTSSELEASQALMSLAGFSMPVDFKRPPSSSMANEASAQSQLLIDLDHNYCRVQLEEKKMVTFDSQVQSSAEPKLKGKKAKQTLPKQPPKEKVPKEKKRRKNEMLENEENLKLMAVASEWRNAKRKAAPSGVINLFDEEENDENKFKILEPDLVPGKKVLRPATPPPPPKVVTFPKRGEEAEQEILFDFLNTGLDSEDIMFMKRGYEQLLNEETNLPWLNDTLWVDHPATLTSPKKKRKLDDSSNARVHKAGSARCEGFYKLDRDEKQKYSHTETASNVSSSGSRIRNVTTTQQLTREARSNQRRLMAAADVLMSDLLKFSQLKVFELYLFII